MAQLKQRYFFGLVPSAEIREQLQQGCSQGHFGKGPFHHPLDWHLTLAFLGELAVIPERLSSLVAGVQSPAFDLCLDFLDYWPRPRVLVLCPQQKPRVLFDLAASMWRSLAPLGLSPEKYPFRPHLTLGRRAAPCAPGPIFPSLCWRVEGFGLFVSDWARPAPQYRMVAWQPFL